MNINMTPLDEIWSNIPNYPNKYKSRSFQQKVLPSDKSVDYIRLNNGNMYQCNENETEKTINIQLNDHEIVKYLQKFTLSYQISHVTEIIKDFINKSDKTDKSIEYYEYNNSKDNDTQTLLTWIIIGLLIILGIEKLKNISLFNK